MPETIGEGATELRQRQPCRDFQLVQQQQPHMNSTAPEKPAAVARLPAAQASPAGVGGACWCSARAAEDGQAVILRGEEPTAPTSTQATERRAKGGAAGAGEGAGEGGAAVAAAPAAAVSGVVPALLPHLSRRWTASFGAGSPGFRHWTTGHRRSSRGRSTVRSLPASRSERKPVAE